MLIVETCKDAPKMTKSKIIEEQDAARALGGGASETAPASDDQHSDAPYNFDDRSDSVLADPSATGAPFRVMGYNNGVFFYFPRNLKQVVALTPTQHTIPNLLLLAPYPYLEAVYGGEKPSPEKIARFAMTALMAEAIRKGVFKLEEVLRGTGIWVDAGRLIVNGGKKLYVDGVETPFDGFKSKYTYAASVERITPIENPLSNYEAARFLKLCDALSWSDPVAHLLLAGWVVISPFCASLKYRPHLYITGETDSGKSTVVDDILKPALGDFGFHVHGGTTEPAMRQHLGYDARPIIFDEAEGEVGKQSMAAVLELARKASSGSVILKFGQSPFKAQFSICFSAINPPVDKSADENRISFLTLRTNRKATAIQDFEDIKTLISEIITSDFSSRLLQRSIINFEALQKNIETFQTAARVVLKAARTAKQIGTLLAGAYSLGRTGVISRSDAENYIRKHDWGEITPIHNDGDPVRLIQHISSFIVKYSPISGNSRDETVGSLIGMVLKENDAVADKILRQYAIKVLPTGISIGDRGQNMARILRGTDWEKRWNRALGDIPGAVKVKKDYFMRGVSMNAIRLPVDLFADEREGLI